MKVLQDISNNGVKLFTEIDETSLPIGGTTGEVLTKASNANGDVEWTTVSGAGDMTKAVYDTNDDGSVNLADAINGVSTAGSLKYYGTNVAETVGFYDVPEAITSHTDLTDIGTNTHQEIDTKLSDLISANYISTVAHDTSLTGDGTNTDPLSVVMDSIADGSTYVKTEVNYSVADAARLSATSGVNTGDQDLTDYVLRPELLGKSKMFTVVPSNYVIDDMWIVNDGTIDIPDGISPGDIVITNTTSEEFDWLHWNKIDKYIQQDDVELLLEPINTQLTVINNDLDLNNDIGKLSIIYDNIDTLSQTVSLKGGNNLIPDSVQILLMDNNEDFTKTGTWTITNNQYAVCNKQANVNNGSVWWRINTLPNNYLTLSLTYNNTSGANTTIKLTNGTEILLVDTSSEVINEFFSYGFLCSGTFVELEILTDGEFNYTDLMLNYGAKVEGDTITPTPLVWQPYAGELIGNNVLISSDKIRYYGTNFNHIIYRDGEYVTNKDDLVTVGLSENGLFASQVEVTDSIKLGGFTNLSIDYENSIEY